MRRLAYKASKLFLPCAFAVYALKPTFGIEPENKKNNNVFIEQPSLKTIATASNNNPTPAESSSYEGNRNQSSQDIVVVSSNENNVDKNQKSSQKSDEKGELSGLDQSSQPKIIEKQQNVAEVSGQIPAQFRKYLSMQGVRIIETNLQQKNRIAIRNQEGAVRQFDCQNSEFSPHVIFQISHFLKPIQIISTQEQVSRIFKSASEDQYIIAAFIPTEADYDASRAPKSHLDTYSATRGFDVKGLKVEFTKQKRQSDSNKKHFVMVRDPEIARAMKMNPNKLGQKYIYYRTTPNQGMETSALLEGRKFTIKAVPLGQSRGLYGLINEIDYEGDLKSLLRSKQLTRDARKILVIYSKQRRPEFLKQVKSIALKSAKMMRDDAIVVMTNNQSLLQKYFQIAPDSFVTIRLIDTQKIQPPILSLPDQETKQKRVYSRTTMSGPFSVENLCKFVQNKAAWIQYYERKAHLPTLESIVSLNENQQSKTVVLHWKSGCKGCELTMNYLEHIKNILGNLNQEQILKYEIERPTAFKNVQFRKFNILNESNQVNQKDHDVTPKLILHSQGRRKDLAIGEILGRIADINPANEEEMHEKIMREIIQVISTNLQALEDE